MKPTALNSNASSARPWYTQRWPWLLMLGPFIVVLAGSYTGWLAFSRQDALVVGDYYKQGKAINQDLRRDRVAASLGLSLNMRYDAAAGRLLGTVHSTAPQTGKLELHLAHSTLPEKDIKLEVLPDSQGDFSVSLPMLERTHWQVLVENEKREWRLSGNWKWPQQKAIDIIADMAPAA